MCVESCSGFRVMVTSVLADRHPGELHIFRNYNRPSVSREAPYATTATFKPLTVPQGTSSLRWEPPGALCRSPWAHVSCGAVSV